MPDASRRNQLEDRVEHAEAGAENRHDNDVMRDTAAARRAERTLDRDVTGRHFAGGFGGEQQADPHGHATEQLGRRRRVAQGRERIVNERVRDEMQWHGVPL